MNPFPSLPIRALHFAKRKVRQILLWEHNFRRLREPKVSEGIDDTPEIQRQIIDDFAAAGIPIEETVISRSGFEAYRKQARYAEYKQYQKAAQSPNFTEKALEHYIAAEFLKLNKNDIYIDIANERSPVPEIYTSIFGCIAYRQDLTFPPGIHGNTIGGDAADMPLPDGFASKMALHCSFEHFEGDSDSGLIREAARVLKPGGRLVIIPLYMHAEYSILTDPAEVPKGFKFEPDAVLHCVRGYGNRHGRYYDVLHFVKRVWDVRGPLDITVHHLKGIPQISPRCYVRFAAVISKPAK